MNKISFVFIIFLITSCVSSKKYNQLSGSFQECEQNVQSLKEQNQILKVQNTVLQGKIETLLKEVSQFSVKLDETSKNLEGSTSNNKQLKLVNTELENQLKTLKAGSSEEIANLMEKLQQAQTDLQKREDILRSAQTELEQRSQRLKELELALQQKDDAVKQLRQKVMDALLGFNNKGLTIQEKNGKVYVSLDEQLLFKTGQWEVDPKGQQALSKLAEVLEQNPDINVLIEGHTDHVPMRGTGSVKDNWDLSVMRATAVTRILLKNKGIEPKRITSAGRGEFFPLDEDKTPAARQKNRRTEIILTPRLDEIFRILENN
ncbi:MAG TPA: cell envelope biogenesis protein OmpA [Prolixibacteraceae bacterium]|nr:cell envelope biogenesis protein OmpA [Prolixibacteraceae bacterium]